MIKQIIECDICKLKIVEEKAGDGFVSWGAVHGVSLDGVENPNFCPDCLSEICNHIDVMKFKIGEK